MVHDFGFCDFHLDALGFGGVVDAGAQFEEVAFDTMTRSQYDAKEWGQIEALTLCFRA